MCGYWKPNPGPLQEQVLLTTEPTLHALDLKQSPSVWIYNSDQLGIMWDLSENLIVLS